MSDGRSQVLKAPFPTKPLVFRGDLLVGYEIGWCGRIWSNLTGRVMSDFRAGKGYRGVALRQKGRTIRAMVHWLVAEAYLGPRPLDLEVCHLDGNRTNNAAANLRYDTKTANEADKIAHGTYQHGQRNPSAKLTDTQATEIRVLRAAGATLRGLAWRFGVSESTISRIANRVRRKHA